MVWGLPFLTLPYSTPHGSVYRVVSYLFLLQYSTTSYPVIYTISLLYPYTILYHSPMRPIEIGPNRPRAKTTQGLNDAPFRLNRPTSKIRPKRPGRPKRPIFLELGKNLFWSIKNSGEVLNKLKSRGFRATSLSTYDFSTLYTTLPHNLIKEKLINLIEWTFKREGSPYIACNERQAFFTSQDTKRYKLWSCQNVCEALIYLLDNIYIRFGTKLYRQIVGIPMGTNCVPL